MKKTCNGCRALRYICGDWRCVLGYKIKGEKISIHGLYYYSPKPVEQCPKPKTYKEYFDAEPKQEPPEGE